MKHRIGTSNHRRNLRILIFLVLSLLLVSCVSDPAKVDVKLEESAPEIKVTSYTQALDQVGLMTEIYDTGLVKIQSQGIGDNTGTSGATGGEIQRDITEIMKSTLNAVGGNIQFIEYDPAYIQNQMVTGYSDFSNKMVPDVVITGGITEFDRGLETRGDGTDVGAEANLTGMPGWLPSPTVGIDYGQSGKTGKARITLDFNLKDFQTLAAIKKMTTTNSMVVNKAMADESFGITLFGPTFGRKGSVKKVQGRHNVVRLLVQVSMIQMVGKYLMLPYWRLLGEDSEPDPVVMDTLAKRFYRMDPVTQVAKAQELLYLHGYDVPVTGTLDTQTVTALKQFDAAFKPAGSSLSLDTFVSLYVNVPMNHQTLGRRTMLARLYPDGQPTTEAQTPQQPQLSAPPAPQQQQAVQQRQQPQQQQTAAPQAKPAQRSGKKGMVGRILSDEEW
ncbi:MAG: hypothetical protein JEZ11_09430 [Desulfobacterales bacterium]|nr:hypothetical protein [Desulfobacterales bacterium]